MTPTQARTRLAKLFPDRSVCATEAAWLHTGKTGRTFCDYHVSVFSASGACIEFRDSSGLSMADAVTNLVGQVESMAAARAKAAAE